MSKIPIFPLNEFFFLKSLFKSVISLFNDKKYISPTKS